MNHNDEFCSQWLEPSYGQNLYTPENVKAECWKGDEIARISSACSCVISQTSMEPRPTCTNSGYDPLCESEPTCLDGTDSFACQLPTGESASIPTLSCESERCSCEGGSCGIESLPAPTPETCGGYDCPCLGGGCETQPTPPLSLTSCGGGVCETDSVSTPAPSPPSCEGDDCLCEGYACKPSYTDTCKEGDSCGPITTVSASTSTKYLGTTAPCSGETCEPITTTLCQGYGCEVTESEGTTKVNGPTDTPTKSQELPTVPVQSDSTAEYTTLVFHSTIYATITTCDYKCSQGPTTITFSQTVPATSCPVVETTKYLPCPAESPVKKPQGQESLKKGPSVVEQLKDKQSNVPKEEPPATESPEKALETKGPVTQWPLTEGETSMMHSSLVAVTEPTPGAPETILTAASSHLHSDYKALTIIAGAGAFIILL